MSVYFMELEVVRDPVLTAFRLTSSHSNSRNSKCMPQRAPFVFAFDPGFPVLFTCLKIFLLGTQKRILVFELFNSEAWKISFFLSKGVVCRKSNLAPLK